MFSKNDFINFVKKFLIEKIIKGKIEALKGVKALLLLILDLFAKFWLANLFFFGKKLA